MTAYRGVGSQKWATIGGQRHYFKSKWERNFARYLETLKKHGKIVSWEYEPREFWFEGIKRGCVSYKPDFRVVKEEPDVTWYEVKGFYDSKSLTKIKRFAKYYPDEKLVLIDGDWFKKNKHLKNYIIAWE